MMRHVPRSHDFTSPPPAAPSTSDAFWGPVTSSRAPHRPDPPLEPVEIGRDLARPGLLDLAWGLSRTVLREVPEAETYGAGTPDEGAWKGVTV